MYNAYVGFKDWLFDLMYGESEIIGRIAEFVLVKLPMTRSERELYEHLFGE